MPKTHLPPSPDVEILTDDHVWTGRFPLQIVRFRHRRFDGAMSGVRTWELWRRGTAAAVLPYDPVCDAVVLIEQFRFPAFAAGLDPVLLELAAGLADGAEDPEAVARREAEEELGFAVGRLEKIGGFLLTPGGCDEYCTIFAAELDLGERPIDGVIGHAGLAAEDEDILVRAMPAAAAIELALAGKIPNSVTALGLMWLNARRDMLRQKWRREQAA
jgi:ADP-ribose pyrophosphatase